MFPSPFHKNDVKGRCMFSSPSTLTVNVPPNRHLPPTRRGASFRNPGPNGPVGSNVQEKSPSISEGAPVRFRNVIDLSPTISSMTESPAITSPDTYSGEPSNDPFLLPVPGPAGRIYKTYCTSDSGAERLHRAVFAHTAAADAKSSTIQIS